MHTFENWSTKVPRWGKNKIQHLPLKKGTPTTGKGFQAKANNNNKWMKQYLFQRKYNSEPK